MAKIIGTLVSVHIGEDGELAKIAQSIVQAELDGFIGDRHRGFSRVAYEGDTEPEGTVRRNNRQWTGVSVEEQPNELTPAVESGRSRVAAGRVEIGEKIQR